MRIKYRRPAALTLLLLTLPALLSGCWDNRELNHLLIVTGIALDTSETPDKIDMTIQVGDFSQKSSDKGSGGSGASGTPTIILKTTSDTLLSGINELNRDSNHNLLMQHNQIRLFSIELAEQGLDEYLDFFMRDPRTRLEVPLLLVDGRAEDALTAELPQEAISGIFLSGMMRDLAKMSVRYKVRLIDFVYALLEKHTAPVIPIIKVTSEGEEQQIQLDGLAVFREDKMIGRLDNEDAVAFFWAMGDVSGSSIQLHDGESLAVMNITRLNSKQAVTLKPDGGVKVDLHLQSTMLLGEMQGFGDMKPPELTTRLKALAEQTIKERITGALQAAQELNADIFGFGTEIYRKYPKQWKQMEANWDDIFSNLDLNIDVQIDFPLTGQIVQSLEMEKGME